MSEPGLTVLCVTNMPPHAPGFLERHAALAQQFGALHVVALDGQRAQERIVPADMIVEVESCGYVESVLDQAVAACPDDGWILRLDDDETITPALADWLQAGGYREAPHWAFPRLHLYPAPEWYITTPPLYPDLQTRLSLKRLAGGRTRVHEGSPHGTGSIGPAGIVHHKFVCRPLAERRAVLERYEGVQPGAGRNFAVFSAPEDFEGALAWGRVPS